MARYNNLGKPGAGGGGGISTEIEPVGGPPKKRTVNPVPETQTASAVGGGGGAQEEAYGPTFRDVGHQQDITSRGMSPGQTEMMFSSDNAPQQIGTVAPGPGGANTWAPQDPSYTGRDARFLAADMDVTPPGYGKDRAGLDTREMQTNIPGQTPDIYGSGGWWEHGGPPGSGGAEAEGTIPNYYNTDIETERVAPPPGWKPPPPDAPQYPGTTPVNYYTPEDPVEPIVADPFPDPTRTGGRDTGLMLQDGTRTTLQTGGNGGMADPRQSVLNQQGGGGGGGTPQQHVPRGRPGATAPQVQTSPRTLQGTTPQYGGQGAPPPQAPEAVGLEGARGQAQVTKPGEMTPESSNVLQRNMEGLAESDNPLDISLHNVLSQTLEQGGDIDSEALVPRLKNERERLSEFRDTAQRQLLSDLARRGFQLGGAQEAAVLGELERQIATQTAQAFRGIVNDERTRADQRLSQSMQIASAQQQQAQQLGLSREQLGVQARVALGQEQLGYEQLGLAGEQLGLQARTAYGQERLGQEQLAVQQRLGLGQEALGYGQLGLGGQELAVQERLGLGQEALGIQQLGVQERLGMGQEALGYAGLDVTQQLGMEQARLQAQELAVQESLGLGQLDVARHGAQTGRMGAQTAQYNAETQSMAMQNDTILRDLELSDSWDKFQAQMDFDQVALKSSIELAEKGMTMQYLGMLNQYADVLGRGQAPR